MPLHSHFKTQNKGRFRAWKSGKFWLFSAGLITLSILSDTTQSLANELQPTNSNDPQTSISNPIGPQVSQDSTEPKQTDPALANTPSNFDTVDKLTANEVVNSQQEVRIHYTPHSGDQTQYYAWVWGDNETHNKDGRFLPLLKQADGKSTLKVTPEKGKQSFKYIITDKNDWKQNPNKVSGDSDMTASVNNVTATDIYHGADGWYSQFQNVQTPEFDRKFGYTDKIITDDGTFKTVGKAGNLGATLHDDGTATINLWAPTAKAVEINLYRSVDENAPLLKSLQLTRGTDYTPNDHTQNTVGLWSITLRPEDLENGLALDQISYDFKLTIPKAYFIQKNEEWREKSPGQWEKVGDQYINSASLGKGKTLDKISTNESKAKISKFFVGADETVITQDPYSQATIKNGKRSVIVNPSKIGKKVTVSNNVRVNSKTELSVLEVDVRDFTIDPSSGVSEANKGNYLGFVESGTTNPKTGQKTGIDYLKYLGAKYIQMMPIYDFQTVPELSKDDPKNNEISKEFSATDQQNWGYDPKNYNVPEGSYSSDPDNPKARIEEVKTMVQKLHDAGINIIMDVVYNHLYDGQNNPFEYTVPGYYYAINGDGKMNNDIGVGNAVRTNSEMMRQYIVNSIAYWATEYGMDGFRFDAMSDLDTTTMNAIRSTINKIDKRIVTYGEGWNSMGTYLKKDGESPSSVANAQLIPEVGFFDSIGRDAISGSHYDNQNPPGFVNNLSNYKHDEKLLNVLTNSLLGGNNTGLVKASQQLNYVEVHDGMTLSDLMRHYNSTDSDAEHLNRVELATAMSALSQGIHFSQHGQEFLRSKMNAHNTYNAGDEKNKIDWDLISKNADAVNFTKSLMALRQNEPLWHLSDYLREVQAQMTITNAQVNSGIVTFELRQPNDDKYLVVFNNNTSSDNNHSLTLGGDNYYYGKHIDKGRINFSNDFTNAFIVTTNSKNLYDKIGKINGEKTITLDKLTATVLYIPRTRIVSQENITQTINYVDKKQSSLVTKKVQTVTKAIIEQTDMAKKFNFSKSGIGAENESVLGFKDNVLNKVNKENATIQTTYYATDGKGNLIETKEAIRLADSGKPVDTANVTWVTGDSFVFKEVPHPEVNDYKVVDSTETSKDLIKVPTQALTNHEVTVTYAKKAIAYLVSSTDPDNILATTKEQALTKSDQHFNGVEGEMVTLSTTLDREGYTYTVNGQSTLEAAIQNNNQGKLGETDDEYVVSYTPKKGIIEVLYLDADDNNKQVKREILEGQSNGNVSFTPNTPDNYDLIRDDSQNITQFDRKDDNMASSQTITVYLKQKHSESNLTTKYTVSYTGTDQTIEDKAIDINWLVDQNLVTNMTTYTPESPETSIVSPNVVGYRPSLLSISVNPQLQTSKPTDINTTVTYTSVPKPDTAFSTVEVFEVDGERFDTLPDIPNLIKLGSQDLTQGKEAVYTWNPVEMDWELTRSAVPQTILSRYRRPAVLGEPIINEPLPNIEVVPAFKIEKTAKKVVPSLKLENTAKTVIPALKLENTAKTVIPALSLEKTAKTVIPALKLENTAKTVIPALKIEKANKTVDKGQSAVLEPLPNANIQVEKTNDNEKTITTTELVLTDQAGNIISKEVLKKQALTKPIILDELPTVEPALKLENTAKTVIPALKLENTAKKTSKGTSLILDEKPTVHIKILNTTIDNDLAFEILATVTDADGEEIEKQILGRHHLPAPTMEETLPTVELETKYQVIDGKQHIQLFALVKDEQNRILETILVSERVIGQEVLHEALPEFNIIFEEKTKEETPSKAEKPKTSTLSTYVNKTQASPVTTEKVLPKTSDSNYLASLMSGYTAFVSGLGLAYKRRKR